MTRNGKYTVYNFLRWTEKYTKTDMVYIVKNGFWTGLGQLISLTLVFVLSVIFARFLPKEVYGNYKFIISAASILGSLALSGMGTAVLQAVAKGKEGIIKIAVKDSLKWGSITLISSIILGIYYWSNDNLAVALAIIFAGITNPLISTYGLYISLLAGKKDFKTSSAFIATTQTISTLSLIIGSIIIPNALILIIINFSVNTLFAVLFYSLTIKKYPPNEESDPEMLDYGKHLSFMNMFGAVINQIDKILVFHYLGAIELAVYSFAIAIPEQIRGSYKSLFAIGLPKFSVREIDLKKSLWSKTKKLTVITLFIIAIYILLVPYIYKIFFPAYLESIFYSKIYILGLITVPGISLFSTYFSIKKETKILYWISIITNTSTLILSYILIKKYGLLGAVMENTISWVLMLVVNGLFFYSRKESRNIDSN